MKLLYYQGKLVKPEKVRPESPLYHEILDEYERHLSSLPGIEVSEELKKVWKDGEWYEEQKDFLLEVCENCEGKGFWIDQYDFKNTCAVCKGTGYLLTAPPQKEEDELWNEFISYWYDWAKEQNFSKRVALIKEIKSRFTIKRRTQKD